MTSEIEKIKARYERRKKISSDRYSILNPATYLIEQEKERALIRWIKKYHIEPLGDKKLLEIGCGTGSNIQKFIRFGFNPSNIYANDLIDERLEIAKLILPSKIIYLKGDALDLDFNKGEFDIVFQSMVFSSILNDDFRRNLAHKMWNWVNPGGGVLWYDFFYNNPFNQDVKKVTLHEVEKLFPNSIIKSWKITLAPPLSRFVTKLHPTMYTFLNSFSFLRTHLLCWIKK